LPGGTTPTTTNGVATASPGTTNASAATTAPTAAADNSVAQSSAAATPEKTGQYLLQAGAFRNNVQADDLKARIAMIGLVGHVETVQTPSGEMHRVRLGPYATASELNAAKQKLNSNGMQPVAVRVK
jgi:cell division protein FtsN